MVGDPFELDLAVDASGDSETVALACIDELATRQLIKSAGAPRRFAFRHPLVRNAIYNGSQSVPASHVIDGSRRRSRSRGASPAMLAAHVEQSATHGDAEAMRILERAGHDTTDQAPSIAVRWFEAALRLVPHTRRPRLAILAAQAASQPCSVISSGRTRRWTMCLARSGDVGLVAACADVERLLGLIPSPSVA